VRQRRRSSFGSARDIELDSKREQKKSVRIGPLEPLDVSPRTLAAQEGKSPPASGNSRNLPLSELDKKTRRLRKTMEPGSIDFDLGFTADDFKEKNKSRAERQTIAKEKRDGAIEAQRLAALESIDKKDAKITQYKAKLALLPVQKKLLTVVLLAVKVQRWMDRSSKDLVVFKAEKVKHDAARRIQRLVKKFMRAQRLVQAVLTRQRLVSVDWRCKFWIRCVRRRLASRQLQSFFQDFSVQQVAYIIFTFRFRVVRVQRMMKSFLAVKKARKMVLEKMWTRLERRISDDDSAFKNSRKSVLPELGERLKLASERFEMIEKQLKAKNLAYTPFEPAKEVEDRSFIETTAKGVEVPTMKFLVRVHLENQRAAYNSYAEKKLKEAHNAPVVTEDHAKALLRGDLLHVDSDNKREWPVFSLYKGGKAKFLEIIEEAIKDKEAVAERMEERRRYEWEVNMSNRYELDAGEEEGGEENKPEDGGEGEEEDDDDDDDVMTPEEELAENEELAEAFHTTAHEVQEFREMFQLVDLDHGGSIDGEELGKLLSLLGMEKSEEEIQELVDKIDTTGQGEVFFPDFVRALKSDRPSPKYTEKMVMNAFKFFETKETEGRYEGVNIRNPGLIMPSALASAKKKGGGVIRKQQITFGLVHYKDAWTEEKAENLLHDAGLTTAEVDYQSYVHVMFQLANS
jgi:hypothetical protein